MKVALVGGAPSSYKLAPYADESWEIWACSPQNTQKLARVTRWFELHAGEDLWTPGTDNDFYMDWLRYHAGQGRLKLYMQDKSVYADAIVFPKDEMVKAFSPYFFSSSFAWMMALAITEGATDIALYGIDMSANEEYARQRPNMHHFIWVARERGINVTAPWESDILQEPPLYGYCMNTSRGRKQYVRRRELRQRLEEAKRIIDEQRYNLIYLEGAIDDQQYESNTFA